MRDNHKAEIKSVEEYALALAADVAERGLKSKLNRDDGHSMYEISLTIVGDGRICSKVYTLLKEKGILESFNFTREYSSAVTLYNYHHSFKAPKSTKRWYGVVSQEWFEKNSPAMAKAPVFETSGLKRVPANSWSDEKKRQLVIEKDNYRPLFSYNSFKEDEYIYLYLNFDDYIVEKFVEKMPHGYGGKESVVKIYPKVLLSDLSKGIFYGHASDYLDKHFEWVVKNVLDIPDDKILNKFKFGDMHVPYFLLENWTDFVSYEHVTRQLLKIKQMKTMLELGEKAWLKVDTAVDKLGGWDNVKKIARDKFWTYLQENFPLHIGDNEKDKDLKKLCEWMMQGKSQGFNEAEQSVSKTTTPQEV